MVRPPMPGRSNRPRSGRPDSRQCSASNLQSRSGRGLPVGPDLGGWDAVPRVEPRMSGSHFQAFDAKLRQNRQQIVVLEGGKNEVGDSKFHGRSHSSSLASLIRRWLSSIGLGTRSGSRSGACSALALARSTQAQAAIDERQADLVQEVQNFVAGLDDDGLNALAPSAAGSSWRRWRRRRRRRIPSRNRAWGSPCP